MNPRLQTTVLMLAGSLMASAPAAAQLTGTLFTSPEQREYLDYLRQEFLASSSERGFDITESEIPDVPTAVAEAEAAGPVVYTLGGIVSLRDGTQRIWLNGQSLREDELPEGMRLVEQDGSWLLNINHQAGTYQLKPGQSVELGDTKGPQERHTFSQRPPLQIEPSSPGSLEAAPVESPAAQSQTEASAPEAIPASTVQPDDVGEVPRADALTASIMELDPEEMGALIEALEQARSDNDEDIELDEDDAE